MGKSKFGTFIVLGAIAGAAISLLDRKTRESVVDTTKKVTNEVTYYTKNPSLLKERVQNEAQKYQSLYERFSEDAVFLKDKVGEFKEIAPQMKAVVSDAKDALVETKQEYNTVIQEGASGKLQ